MMASQKLWQVWWLWGMPVAWAASALLVGAELARSAGQHSWGNAQDVARLALYWWWMRMAWTCSGNVANRLWSPVSRTALVLGLAVNALF
jgi:hypothetical protein